ncbi:MAG TPA: Dam family site-specific DNA-(adenine-N6)-methyltransferase [Vicinamibacterales bacterium]|nr:Dam family site-specific DNA-(adenine-N6)-methyltransferase [Vicinamibacterales bacterium]
MRVAELPAPSSESLPPPLKWAGGKRWQLPHLAPLWRRHDARRLVEPFCGGLAAALGLRPRAALLNDANPHVMIFYRRLKGGLAITLPMENDEALYYAHRDRFNELVRQGNEDSDEAAGLFYYLNRTGYNGLCRFNQAGRFNVPFGSHRRIAYRRDFSAYRAAFAHWDFTSGDFEAVRLEAGDFVYADPPYDVEFRQYSAGGFSWEDQVRAAGWLAGHRGPVMLVNQATPRIVELYAGLGYHLEYLAAPRRISCTGDRTPAREVVATRNT